MSRATFWFVGSWMFVSLGLAASCDDEVVDFPAEAQTNTTTSAAGGNGGGTANGGTGAAPFSCDDCTPPDSICVDDLKCDDKCPAGRQPCHISDTASDPSVCCAMNEQCCEAADNGYTGGDICHPLNQGCPKACPGGDVVCDADQYCALDAETMTYSCVDTCNDYYKCGGICCPLGTWQALYLWEHRARTHRRQLTVHVSGV